MEFRIRTSTRIEVHPEGTKTSTLFSEALTESETLLVTGVVATAGLGAVVVAADTGRASAMQATMPARMWRVRNVANDALTMFLGGITISVCLHRQCLTVMYY